jgi:Fe-S cluster assembly iron-binding protein IscA
VITLSPRAARAIRARCADAGAAPSVRVHLLGGGAPLPVELVPDTAHRSGDRVAAADGVVVLLGRELADAVDGHVLDAWPGEEPRAPRFVLAAT